jgi:hypothetical protein
MVPGCCSFLPFLPVFLSPPAVTGLVFKCHFAIHSSGKLSLISTWSQVPFL